MSQFRLSQSVAEQISSEGEQSCKSYFYARKPANPILEKLNLIQPRQTKTSIKSAKTIKERLEQNLIQVSREVDLSPTYQGQNRQSLLRLIKKGELFLYCNKIVRSSEVYQKIDQMCRTRNEISKYNQKIVMISLITIAINSLSQEIAWKRKDQMSAGCIAVIEILRLLDTLIIVYAILLALMQRINGQYPSNQSPFNKKELTQVIIQLIVFAVHVPPFIEGFNTETFYYDGAQAKA